MPIDDLSCKSLLVSPKTTIGKLAQQISEGKIDVSPHSGPEASASNCVEIGKLLTNEKILDSILAIAAQGTIKPLHSSGMPHSFDGPPGSPNDTSRLSSEDAEVVVRCLRVAISRLMRAEVQQNAKTAAGRHNIEEIAHALATHSGIEVMRWIELIVGDVKRGALALKNPRNFDDQLPYAVPKSVDAQYDQIQSSDVNDWLERHPDWGVTYRFATPVTSVTRVRTRTQTTQKQWVKHFDQAISKLGLDRQALPVGDRGKRGVRYEIAKALGRSSMDKSFANAWDRALQDGDIKFFRQLP